MTETAIDPLADALDALDDPILQRIDSDFSLVMQLACGKGAQAIIEEASLWNQDWSEQFAEMHNDYERAMWTFLNEPRRFEAAGAFHEMDRFSFNWHRFVGYRLEVQTDEAMMHVFAEALASHYRRQGRGRHCHVDVYRRVDPERYCFFAYPEDAANTDTPSPNPPFYNDQTNPGIWTPTVQGGVNVNWGDTPGTFGNIYDATFNFRTYVICVKGDAAGRIYGGLEWEVRVENYEAKLTSVEGFDPSEDPPPGAP